MSMTFEEWAARYPDAAAALSLVVDVGEIPEGSSEAAVQAKLRVEAANIGYCLWRNNSGSLPDKTGRWVRFGLGNDSEKLKKVFSSPDLVGIGKNGIFVAVEVKPPGWKKPRDNHEVAQANFLGAVRARGGLAGFATSVEDYHSIVGYAFDGSGAPRFPLLGS